MNRKEIIDFEQLWDSGTKCRRSVTWKPSTKSFILNQFERTLKMEKQLKAGAWKNSKPKPIRIMHPKKRDGLSIPFKDRVYQRSINDNELYPTMTHGFIYDNAACQQGKGPDFARKRLEEKLHRYFLHYGADGWVLQIDIHGYYPSMDHEKIKHIFRGKLQPDVYQMVADILDQQYEGSIGYNPGSQMVQIAGISTLDQIDHKCKEQLHMKNYIRYMDDFFDVEPDQRFLQCCLTDIVSDLSALGLTINEKKTHITPLRDGFSFLGWNYRLTDTGKAISTLDSQNIKHERRKLRRMAEKVKRGEMSRKKADECYAAWKSYAAKGNTWKLLQRMDGYYQSLWRDENGTGN